MAAPRFKATVHRILGPALQEHGFEREPNLEESIQVVYTRTLRGYPNEIMIDLNPRLAAMGTKQLRFVLRAPKDPMISCTKLTGGRQGWVYETAEDLKRCLGEVRELLLSEGLKWLDTYTPGNVPPWTHLLDDIITPVLVPLGFSLRRGEYGRLPDVADYYLLGEPDSRIRIDLRVPGKIAVYMTRALGSGPLEYQSSPPFAYTDGADLPLALYQARDYLSVHASALFGSRE